MSFIFGSKTQSQADLSAQAIANEQAQVDAQKNAIDLYTAQQADYANKNKIAVNNPRTFAGQAALASLLRGDRFAPVAGGAGGGRGTGIDDNAKGALSNLQQQAITSLLASPQNNPVPSASSVVAPTLQPVDKADTTHNHTNWSE